MNTHLANIALLTALLFPLLIANLACSSAQNDDVLRIALAGQPTSLDPNKANDAISSTIIMQLHAGLTQQDEQLNVLPNLAQNWQFSDDFTQITYNLRKDITWSDGSPIHAQDFVYSWLRLLNPETGAEYAYFLYDIQGAQEYNEGKVAQDNVQIHAPDPYTIHIKLNRPAPYFPHLTAFMVTFPLKKELVETYPDSWHLPQHFVASGPFTLTELSQDYRFTLKPNKNYKKNLQSQIKTTESQAKTTKNIKKLEFYTITERSTALNLFLTGHIDIITELLPIAIPSMKNNPSYINKPMLEVRYVAFRHDHPITKNLLVRKALTAAIDRTQFPQVLKGGEIPTQTWIPPGMFGHNDSVGLLHDPQIAQKLLAEAGYPDGKNFPKLTLMLRSGDDWRLIAENIQQQWKKNLNIDVELQVHEPKVFFREIDSETPPPLHLARWIADFPDPENFMNLFTSNSGNNSLKFADSSYDQLVDQAVQISDPNERQQLYDQAQQILLQQQCAIAPIYVAGQNMLINKNFEQISLNALGNLLIP